MPAGWDEKKAGNGGILLYSAPIRRLLQGNLATLSIKHSKYVYWPHEAYSSTKSKIIGVLRLFFLANNSTSRRCALPWTQNPAKQKLDKLIIKRQQCRTNNWLNILLYSVWIKGIRGKRKEWNELVGKSTLWFSSSISCPRGRIRKNKNIHTYEVSFGFFCLQGWSRSLVFAFYLFKRSTRHKNRH